MSTPKANLFFAFSRFFRVVGYNCRLCLHNKRPPQQSRDGLFGSISRAVLRQYYCLPLQAGAARQPARLIIYHKEVPFNDCVKFSYVDWTGSRRWGCVQPLQRLPGSPLHEVPMHETTYLLFALPACTVPTPAWAI